MSTSLSRRDLLRGLPGVGAAALLARHPLDVAAADASEAWAADFGRDVGSGAPPQAQERPGPMSPDVLPAGIRSRFVENINGLRMHVLEAGFETPGRPAVLLLHGFPELAFSWRQESFSPEQQTEVVVRFEPAGKQTRVTVEHIGWDSIPREHVARHRFPLDVFQLRHAEWWQALLARFQSRALQG